MDFRLRGSELNMSQAQNRIGVARDRFSELSVFRIHYNDGFKVESPSLPRYLQLLLMNTSRLRVHARKESDCRSCRPTRVRNILGRKGLIIMDYNMDCPKKRGSSSKGTFGQRTYRVQPVTKKVYAGAQHRTFLRRGRNQ